MALVDSPVELDVARLVLAVCLVLEPDLKSLASIASKDYVAISSIEIVEGAGLILMKSVEGADDIFSKGRLILKSLAFELIKKSQFLRVLELIISLSLL